MLQQLTCFALNKREEEWKHVPTEHRRTFQYGNSLLQTNTSAGTYSNDMDINHFTRCSHSGYLITWTHAFSISPRKRENKRIMT